ncbi:MAG: hypothetical protein IJB59_08235 [Oscillospiraceae bacterium]|nr:hypothetical protein [Oscillospiraceae bacterium]
MEILKRSLSAFLALVLVLGMMPIPAHAAELEIQEMAETEAVETAAPVETEAAEETAAETEIPETTAAAETAPAETVPEETQTLETQPAVTEPVETEEQQTVPEETESEIVSEDEANADSADDSVSASSITQTQFDALLAEAKRTGFLNLNDQVTLTKNVTIPENVQFNIDWAGGVVVPSGKTLTICGRGNIYGTLQVQTGGTLAIAGEIPVWVCSGATVEIQGNYTHGEYLGILYRYAENGEFRHTLTGVSDTEIGSYIQVQDDSNWAGVLDIFRNPDYMYVTIGVQGNVTLPEDVTAGVNRAICVEGMTGSTLTIPEGVTLTTKSAITVYNNYNLVNNGRIVFNTDNGQSFQIMGNVTNNGTIETGRFCWFYVNGELTNHGRIVNGWDIYVNGKLVNYGNIDLIDTKTADYYALLQVEESGRVDNRGSVDCYGAGTVNVVGTWTGNDPVYHSLPQPINLSWHKMARQGSVQTAKGHIYWQAVNPQDNGNDRYQIYIYNADTDEVVYRDNCSFGGLQTNDRSLPSFIEADLPSGNYYFTVTALSNSDEYEDSAPVRSDVFRYTRPASSIGGARNLHWNGPNACWDPPSKADSLTSYAVQWFYAPDADSEPQMRGGDINVYGTSKNLQPWIVESCGAGYYSFKVRAIPGDGTRYTVGDWMESGQFYYDPATFAYDESYLVNLHSSRPPQMDESMDFKFLQDRVVLQNDLALPENTFLDINRGGSITVPAGKTLTLNHATQVYNGGKLIVEEGGKLIVNAYLWLGFDGTLDVQGEIEFAQNQWIYVNFGNDFSLNGVSDDKVFKEFLFDPGLGRVEDLLNEFENSTYGWNVMRVEGEMTLPRSLTSPVNSNILITVDSSLIIPQGKVLTIARGGEMHVAGKLYNNGTIQGLEQDSGHEAVLFVPAMGYVRNNGRVIANTGTVVDVAGTWEGNAPERNGGTVNMMMSFQDFKKQVEEAAKHGWQVELSSSVTLEASLTIPRNVNLRMVNGARLIIPKGKTLTLNGLGNSMMNDCQLIVEEGGKLALNGDMSLNDNDRLIVNGSFTAGKTVNGALGKIQMYYGSGCEVAGVPMANQALNIMVSGSFDGSWDGYLDAFANNDYGVCYLQIHTNAVLDQEMVIPENGELCIWRDQTLTNNSTIINNGKINVYEGILDNNGEIHVHDGAALQNYGTVNNNGHVYAYYGSSISNGGPGIAAVWNGPGAENKDFMTQDQLEAAIANSDSYELNKVVVLERDLVLADKELVIGAEGRLIVPGGKTLTINYATNVRGKLEVEKGGKLVQNDWLLVYPGGTILNAGSYVAPKNECFLEIYSKQASLPRVEGIAKKYQRVQFDDVDVDLLNYAIGLQKEGYAAIRLYSEGLTLDADVTIPKVITLVIGGSDSSALTINGNLTLNGAIVLDRDAVLVNNGSFTMNKGSELYFYGTWEGRQPVNKGGITYPHATAAVIAGEDTLTLDVVQAAGLELAVSVSGNNTPQYGSNYLQFVTWTSSNKKVVDPADIIFEDGVYKITRAGVGTTKLTAASVATDAKGKTFSDTVTLTVTDIQATGLTLAHDAGENSTPEQVILVKNGEAKTFTVTPEAMTAYGTAKPLTGKNIKWTVSNSKLAAIKANADGSATVTVKAGASGEAVITAQLTAQKDMTANLDLAVMDYQPRLEKNAFTMNSRQENPTVTTRLTEQEKAVTGIRLYEYSKAHKGYLETESQRFEAVYENGLLTITKTDGAEEKNAVQLLMQVDCEGVEEPFGYELKITMKNAVPAVTVKQPAKFNLFYTDSRTGLEITAKDARVTNVTIRNADAEQFAVESFNAETGILTLKLNTYSKKPDAKLDLLVELEGFGEPVVKSVSVGTASVKPSLILSPASSTIYTVFGADEYYFSFKVCDKTTGAVLDDCFGTIRSKTHKIEAPFEGGELNLTTTAEMADTLTVMVQKENWSEAIQLTHSLKVDKNAPKIKLSTSTVKFNTFFYNERTEECTQVQTVQVTLDKNASGIQVVDLLIPNLEEDAPVDFRYDPDTGVLTLRLKDAAKAKYTYTLVPVISDGVNIKTLDEKKNGIKLTVQAEEKTPKVTQSAKGKLDVLDPDSEVVYTISKISEATGLVTDVKLLLSDGTKDAKGKLIYKESDKFLVSLGETVKGKQTVVLKLDNTQLYEPSYKLKLVYTVDGEEIETSELSVKVTTPFKPLTVKYSLKSGTKPVAAKLTMNSGVKATVKPFTADELLDMINWEESDIKLLLGVDTGKSTFSVSKDGKSVQASVVFSANHKLEEGNIYHLALNVTFVCSDGVERTVPVVVPVQVTK